jgi:hypothetical protein
MEKNIRIAAKHVAELQNHNLPDTQLYDYAKMVAAPTVLEDSVKKTLKQGTEICRESFEVFNKAYRDMAEQQLATADMAKKHSSFLKDRANQIAESLQKIQKIVGGDFETRLQQLERFTDAVERLDALQKSGRLEAISKALQK